MRTDLEFKENGRNRDIMNLLPNQRKMERAKYINEEVGKDRDWETDS